MTRLLKLSVPTTAKGYERLLRWSESFGPVSCAGIEGTSSYGAGIVRHLRAQGVEVLEVERPKRRQRSSHRNVTRVNKGEKERVGAALCPYPLSQVGELYKKAQVIPSGPWQGVVQ